PALVTLKVPFPTEKATGILPQPAPPKAARSVLPSPLKSPATIWTPGVAAQVGKLATAALVTLKDPFPAETATGILPQPAPPKATRSVLPSPLKSPLSIFTPGVAAQVGKLATPALVIANVPLPFEAANGMLPQPAPPNATISVLICA